ncbi:hypothetical protein RYX36_027814 [Vicia faba]
MNEISEATCLEDSLRSVKQKQLQNHEKLFHAKCMPLHADCKYFLLSSSWILKWRNNTSLSFNNPDIPETLDGTRCGAIIQKESSARGLTIIPENDWRCFCEEWGGTKTKGISATIEHINNSGTFLTGSSDKMLICEDQLQTGHKVNGITPVMCVFYYSRLVQYCCATKLFGCHAKMMFMGSAFFLQQQSDLNVVFYFSSAVFESFGVPPKMRNNYVVTYNLFGLIVSIILIDKLGRKVLILGSFLGMTITMSLQIIAASSFAFGSMYLFLGGMLLYVLSSTIGVVSGKVTLSILKNALRNKVIEIGGIKYHIKGCARQGGFA